MSLLLDHTENEGANGAGDAPAEMTQAEFARHCGVSRAAVSQWKSSNILRDEAFIKPGKKGKLKTAIALEHVRKHRDIGQSLGNGIATKTSASVSVEGENGGADEKLSDPDREPNLERGLFLAEESSEAASSGDDIHKPTSIEDQLKAERLEEQRRKNRRQRQEDALSEGVLMETADVRAQMGRVAVSLMVIFEGALPDFSAKIAEQFSVPQRDVLHLLRQEYTRVRNRAAKNQSLLSNGVHETVVREIGKDG